MPPLISICMPTLNARRFLEPRMASIMSQTLADWELIVCDSYSDDGTWEYLQQFASDDRVKLHRVPREGVYAGWNECLRRATGKYIYVATADDTCRPEMLEWMAFALESAKETEDWVGDGEAWSQKGEGGGSTTNEHECSRMGMGKINHKEHKEHKEGRQASLSQGESLGWNTNPDSLKQVSRDPDCIPSAAADAAGLPSDIKLSYQAVRSKTLSQTHSVSSVHSSDGAAGTSGGKSEKGLQSAVCSLQSSPAAKPLRIAVCNFDFIDEQGKILHPRQQKGLKSNPLPPAGDFYGDDRYRAHVRSGYLEFLVHLLIGTSWTTMTAVLFPRTLLEKTGLFRTDCGALADRFWAYKAALYADTVVVPETLATWRQHPEQGSSPSHGRNLRMRRKLWRATVETLNECAALLPEEWKRQPDWKDKLLWAERRHYFDLYQLNRSALRHRPGEFLNGALSALVLEPVYLLRRLAGGLRWEPDHDLSETDYLRRLLGELQIPGK